MLELRLWRRAGGAGGDAREGGRRERRAGGGREGAAQGGHPPGGRPRVRAFGAPRARPARHALAPDTLAVHRPAPFLVPHARALSLSLSLSLCASLFAQLCF